MKTILITGATGLIGREIVKQYHQKGYFVNYLSTSKDKYQNTKTYKGFYWNPETSEIDTKAFNNVDTIINLAGASISKRWTKAYKKQIVSSRVNSLQLLFNTINEQKIPIKHLISASAIGYYPSSDIHYYEENFEAEPNGFLQEVTALWEAEAQNFKTIGVKTSIIRIGLVLASNGGALPEFVKPIKYYVGSSLGSGNQWQSWIHIKDLARLFLFVENHKIEGIYNAVAPNAIHQKEIIKSIASILERPLWMPNVPAFILKLILGEMSSIVLQSQRISSKKIESQGFNFEFHHVHTALEDLLG